MAFQSSGDIKRFIAGQITANGTSTVSLNVNVLEANSFVHLTPNTISGTPGAMTMTVKTPSTPAAPGLISWTSVAGNTTVYDVVIFP